MDGGLGLMLVACPGCAARLVRTRDPLRAAVRGWVGVVRSLLLLAVRSAALLGAIAWVTIAGVFFAETFFLNRFGEWRTDAGVGSVIEALDGVGRATLVTVLAAGFGAGLVVRVVWGHRPVWVAAPLFAAVVVMASGLDALPPFFESVWNWAQGGEWRFWGIPWTEWMGRVATAALCAPGFVAGWMVGGALRTSIGWDVRRRWRRGLSRIRTRRRM